MKKKHCVTSIMAAFLGISLFIMTFTSNAFAHCDTLDGPVVQTARIALEKGDVTPLLKWVKAEEEQEIRIAFQKTIAVRAKGNEAKELADMYFFETLVRIHRAGEGAPYTGLKPGGDVDPAVALADQAIENGSVDKLVTVLTNAAEKSLRKHFHHVMEARKHTDDSVAAGREFVNAYVVFTHYAEGLHMIIKGSGGHQGEASKGHTGHN